MESIVQSKKECIVCRTTIGLHKHHVFFGQLRKISEKNGFVVWLCANHHNMSDNGVHFNKKLDNEIKKLTQEIFERTHSREEFIEIIGKNYL